MPSYLLFQLHGPMCSWGDVAVGEIRPSGGYPTKSAVLGIIAASLGVPREDEHRQRKLAESYAYAVRVDSAGIPMRDYHTIQLPHGRGSERAATRREELAFAGDNTLQSYRDYVLDASYAVALWARQGDVPVSLDRIRAALQRPQFTPYLGRRSCPPALPFCPRVIEAETLRELFESDKLFPELPGAGIRRPEVRAVYWEPGVAVDIEARQQTVRWDEPLSRSRWQFSRRAEHAGAVNVVHARDEERR